MKILVVNTGSSSIKYKLYEFPDKDVLTKGVIDRIGEKDSLVGDHSQGMKILFERLIERKVVATLEEISAIGHRVVHGGEDFKEACIIEEKVIKKIEECAELAPLHNPANLAGIKAAKKVFPQIVQVAVFDTVFHQTIPEYAYLYPLPWQYYSRYRIRKYGFHGVSHHFVALKASQILRKSLSKLKLITCHLGNGCSITAIKGGKSIDTSMGFTPIEGLMMGTRCGDIDVGLVFYLMRREGLSQEEMLSLLNRKSGLLGISGVSNDVRIVKKAAKEGNQRAKLALEMFIYRIKKYIGAYYFILGGADAICFTAGIGENNPDIIAKIKRSLKPVIKKETKVLVIPTDEELMIAELVYNLLKRKKLLKNK